MIRAAVVGAGTRGREHLAALATLAEVEVVGVVDPDRHARSLVPHGARAVASAAELRGGVDYVVVATPPAGRSASVADAIERWAPRAMLVEKPLGLDVDEAAAIVRRCDDAGVLLAVGYHWRSAPAFGWLADAVRDHRLGPLRRLDGTGFGNLYDQGTHVIDAIRWLTGREVRQVRATALDDPVEICRRLPADLGWYADADHPAPAWVEATLQLDGGLEATVRSGVLNPRVDAGVDDWRQARLHVVGTDGHALATASGRCAITTSGGTEERQHGMADWMRSTTAMHERVLDAVAGGGPVPASGADGVASVEVVVACLQSIASGAPVDLPLASGHPPAAAPRRAPEVTSVSVVVNGDDHRDMAVASIASWHRDQGFDGRVEVLLVTGGGDPALDEEVRAHLGPDDRLLVVPGGGRMDLWIAGAAAATGDVLVITEAHCAAEPGCLAGLLEPLADPRVPASSGRAVAEGGGAFSAFDADVFEQGADTYGHPWDWRHVVPHAFAIRRSTYLGVGGFRPGFDLYAEQLLAAELRRAGLPIAKAHGAQVRHRYARTPAEAIGPATGLARGQAIARTRWAPDDIDRALYPSEGLPAVELSRRTAAAALLATARAGAGPTALLRSVTPVLPLRARIVLEVARLRSSELRCRAWRSGPRMERAYHDLVARGAHLARLEVLRDHGPPIRPALDGAGDWASTELDVARLVGAHGTEHWHGTAFRWLEPVAVLVTDLPPGRWRLELRTGGFGRALAEAAVDIRLDGRRLPPGAVRASDQAVVIDVPEVHLRPGRAQTWTITSRPLATAAGDERRLGVPLVSVAVSPR